MRICRVFLAALFMPAVASAVAANPLDPRVCEPLRTEHEALVAAGAQADMDRGPEWAKANLAAERLQKIERLLALKEQLTFRCGLQLTARPAVKEPPPPPPAEKTAKAAAQPADDVFSALGLSDVPAPKKKEAAKAKKKKRAATQPGQ